MRYGDGWVPNASRPSYADVTEFLPQFRQMAAEAGRDPASVPITIFGGTENLDRVASVYLDKPILDAGQVEDIVAYLATRK